jgi:hypothetical protein
MSVHKMKFVLVNDMAPRSTPVCTACSRPLEQGYLHDLSTSRRYCGIRVLPPMDGGGWVRRIGRSNEPICTRHRLAAADR